MIQKSFAASIPAFDTELDHVVLEELHLMMRITDRLTENIITEVMERDSYADLLKKRERTKEFTSKD